MDWRGLRRSNAVVIFGFHFRWDYVTVMDRVFGLLGRIAEICHEHGLRVVEHHSASFVHRARTAEDRWSIRRKNPHHVPFFPDAWEGLAFEGSTMATWRQVSAHDGQPAYIEEYNAELFCPNHPEFQRAYLRMIERHMEHVEIDALMSDDVSFLPDQYSCACEHCRAAFHKKTGITLPLAQDVSFWEDQSNEDFQAWLDFRYESTADHYRRLRAFLPKNIALWACASDCLSPRLAKMGFAPQRLFPHCDAVFHEIWERRDFQRDREMIVTELNAFASIARQLNKPLLAIFYAPGPEDVPPWLALLRQFGARPWLSKLPRDPIATPEETLLGNAYLTPENFNAPRAEMSQRTLLFSFRHRDRLPADEAEEYVKSFRTDCRQRFDEDGQVNILFEDNSA